MIKSLMSHVSQRQNRRWCHATWGSVSRVGNGPNIECCRAFTRTIYFSMIFGTPPSSMSQLQVTNSIVRWHCAYGDCIQQLLPAANGWSGQDGIVVCSGGLLRCLSAHLRVSLASWDDKWHIDCLESVQMLLSFSYWTVWCPCTPSPKCCWHWTTALQGVPMALLEHWLDWLHAALRVEQLPLQLKRHV